MPSTGGTRALAGAAANTAKAIRATATARSAAARIATARRLRAPPNRTERVSRATPPRRAPGACAREGRIGRGYRDRRQAIRSVPGPLRPALLGEGAHALEEVVGAKAGLAQRDQLAL